MEQSPPIGQRPRLLLQSGGGGFNLSPFEIITLIVVLAVAGYGGYTAYARFTDLNKAPPAVQTFAPAIRTTITSSVSATGTVQSSQQVNLTFDVGQGGGKIKEFMVKLGEQVVAGQPLAKLDDADLAQSLKSAESALASAQARLNAVVSPSAADIASSQQSIASAQSQVTNQQKSLDDLRAGPKPADQLTAQQSVLQAQGSLQTAQNNLTKGQTQIQTDQTAVFNAQNDLTNAQNSANNAAGSVQYPLSQLQNELTACNPTAPMPFFTQGVQNPTYALPFNFTCSVSGKTPPTQQVSTFNQAVSASNTAISGVTKAQQSVQTAQNTLVNDQKNLASLQASLQTSQAGLSTAQQKLQDTMAPPKQSDIDAATASLEASKKSLEAAQARYDQLLKPKPDQVLPLQASVDQASAQVETAKKLLAAATITAPFDGQISQLNGDVGTQVASNTVVFILLNPRTLRIDANVDQAYVSDLRPNQTATITFDALQGRSYQATVTAVGLTPQVQQGVVSYVVTMGIDTTRIAQGTPIPTPGMTASITIVTNRTENALAVPSRAIRRIGRNQTVTVKTPTGTEQRTVTTGASNGTLIQISSGLADNDEVLVGAPAATTSSTQRTTGGGGTGTGPFGPPR